MMLKILRVLLSTLFITIIILSGIVFAYSYINPCNIPVEFSLGNIDSRFNITSEQLFNTVQDAAKRWNNALGKEVLRYDPDGELKINLVYDSRQQNLDAVNKKLAEIDSSANSIEELKSETEKRINQYDSDLQQYNTKVDYWNSRGGAPENIFNQLNNDKTSLDKTKSLIDSSIKLINDMVQEHNNTVGGFNSDNKNNSNKLFTQGLYYQGKKKIDIFTFGNYNELRLVLMHEIGHSLSTSHDTVDTSIMYPILEKQNMDNPVPSNEDLSMVDNSCRIKNIKYDNKLFRLLEFLKTHLTLDISSYVR